MILYLVLGIILLTSLYMGVRWLAYADVSAVKKFFKWVAIGLGGVGGLFLLLTGKLGALFAAIPFLYMWFGRLQFVTRIYQNLFGMGPKTKYDSNQGGQRARRPGGTTMSREEALHVLGLQEGATDKDIKAAYHRLISQHHPDKGGSDYLASKINQARDVLLNS